MSRPLVTISDCGKGINKDVLPAELELGFWSDSTLNFRFANGIAEKFEGCTSVASLASGPYWFVSYKPSTVRYLVYVTTGGGAYAYNTSTGVNSEITRYDPEQTIVSNNRIGANTAEVTTSVAHGLSTNDDVTVFGATESGYNEANANITVMSSTVFRYTTTNAIAANASVPGSYIVLSGGQTTFTSANTQNALSGGILSGVVILNNPTNGLYYWSGNTSVAFLKFPFKSYVADVGRVFQNYIVQLAVTMDGTKYKRRVLWSDAAEPGALPTSFDSSATNDAGFIDLTGEDGSLVDCLPYGSANIIYSESGRYSMRPIPGSTAVFSFTRLPGDDGLLAPNCVVNTPRGQVFVTASLDVRIHQGAESTSIIDGRLRKHLFDSIRRAPSYLKLSFLSMNPLKSEVIFAFVPSGESEVRRMIAWNWVSDTWSEYRTPNTTFQLRCSHTGLITPESVATTEEQVILMFGVASAGQARIGVVGDFAITGAGQWFGETITGTLERTGIHGGDYVTFKTPDGLMMNVEATPNDTATCYLGTASTADGTVSYTSGGTYTHETSKFVDQRATAGPFMAVKVETTEHPFQIRSMVIRGSSGGTR